MGPPVVVFQGEPGAYSEAAACELLGDEIRAVGLDNFEKCFQALEADEADFAMMPIENSMGGSIHDCFDLQVKHDFHIVAELDFRVRHCLMALKTTKKEDIEVVISHPQALSQCEQYLKRNQLVGRKEYDTAGSAKKIWDEKLSYYAAIASKLAAATHNLTILEEDIEDDPNNVTRFLLLSKKCLIPPTDFELLSLEDKNISYKTTIVLSFLNLPGALCRALSCFARKGLDLTKLESRPNKLKNRGRFLPLTLSKEILDLFNTIQYIPLHGFDASDSVNDLGPEQALLERNKYPFVFYMDVLGSITEHKIISALKEIAAFCVFFRVLGSYPRKGVLQQFVAQAVSVPNNTKILAPSCSEQQEKEDEASRQQKRLKIAIIGFGNFGQFLARTFVNHHKVVACNRSDASFAALTMGVTYYHDPVSMLEAEKDVDVVLFCVAILAFQKILALVPAPLLQDKLLVDVLSVKTFPKATLQTMISAAGIRCGLLCTHPMFGPESGKYSWKSLPMVYEKVDLEDHPTSEVLSKTAEVFLKIFEDEGCQMVEMSCEEHDKRAANSQFITHFLGRLVDRLDLQLSSNKRKQLATTGFKSLLTIRDHTILDSFDLFSALYIYNPNSKDTICKLKGALGDLLGDLEKRRSSPMTRNTNAARSLKDIGFTSSAFVNVIKGSKTADIFGLATSLKEAGKDIVMSLCVGEPDYQPPKSALEATKDAVDAGYTKYTTVQGLVALRQAIARDLKTRKGLEYSPSEILITASGKQGLFLTLMSFVEKGDEVILPSPYWASYPELARMTGAEVIIVARDPKRDFILTAEQLAGAISPRTKFIILCNPCNPTGCMYSAADLEKLAEVLRRPENEHIKIVADEIYERLVYDGKEHLSFAALAGMKHRTILVNGFSKGYAMTGYRLGYLAAELPVIKTCAKLQSQLNSCACSLSQHAGIGALKASESELQANYKVLQEKRDLIVSKLAAIPNLQVPKVRGAFYVFPNVSHYIGEKVKSKVTGETIQSTTALCKYLITNFGVALVAGDAFGAAYGIRLSFAASKEDISQAVERLRLGLESLIVT